MNRARGTSLAVSSSSTKASAGTIVLNSGLLKIAATIFSSYEAIAVLEWRYGR